MTRQFAPLAVRKAYIASREMPRKHRQLYLRATGTNSPTAAVRSFCLECQGYDSQAVKECDLDGCPLHAYRCQGALQEPTENVASSSLNPHSLALPEESGR